MYIFLYHTYVQYLWYVLQIIIVKKSFLKFSEWKLDIYTQISFKFVGLSRHLPSVKSVNINLG